MADLRLHGSKGAIFIGGASGGGGSLVTAKANWTYNRVRDTVEVTAFGDTSKRYVAGLPDASGTYAGFLDNDGDSLLSAAGDDPVLLYLYSQLDPTPILVAHGSAFVDATVTVASNDAVRINGNFRASAAWTTDLA